MKKQIGPDNFATLVERLTERMQSSVKSISDAVVSDNTLSESEHRTSLRAYDMALFLINLNSSIVEEKATDGQD